MRKLIFIVMILISQITYSLNFSIAPTKFHVNLDKPETQEAYIINNTAQPLRIEIYVDIAEGYEENNLNSNITIFPKIISIKPGGKQTIRFRVKANKNLKVGEYKSLLVFKESPNEIKEIKEDGEKDLITDFKFLTEIAVGVTGVKSK